MAQEEESYDFSKMVMILEEAMEEMAGAPREEMGKRTPGERNMYELHNERLWKERMGDSVSKI